VLNIHEIKNKYKSNKSHKKDNRWIQQQSNILKKDDNSHILKFDLRETNLRTISEAQSNNTNDILRENAVAHFEHVNKDTDLTRNTFTILSRSVLSQKVTVTNTKKYNLLFLMVLRILLSTVVLLLFGYNLLTSHIEFNVNNYFE